MKLNYKRTLLVGFAFFLICVFWQAYDTLVPLMLTNKFGLDQTWSGVIMSLDNILALFMLPLFGALSDKKDTRFGKRTPFIVIGTICAILAFVSLTLVDNAQLSKLAAGNTELYWSTNYTVENKEYNSITNKGVASEYDIHDYSAQILFNKNFDELTSDEQAQAESWYKGLDYDQFYVYDADAKEYKACKTIKDENGKLSYSYLDGSEIEKGARRINAYSSTVSSAESCFAKEVSNSNIYLLVIFIIVLLVTLVSMATFRSPAVALMPDVTVKPLRSKGNAIINLMGAAGGIIVLGLGMLFGTGQVKNQMMSYTLFVSAVCGIMAIALIVFIFTVKEKKWNAEMLEQQAILDAEDEQEAAEKEIQEIDEPVCAEVLTENETSDTKTTTPPAKTKQNKLPKDKLVSLILILASVALWFIGYNAVTSKYSVYALNVLNMDYNSTLIIAQGAAIASYIPVGMLSGKLGRKKTILIGVALLTVSFFGAIFINSSSPSWLMWILFALAGIAWATINVNSFPMVVELATGSDIGKYTGYYYTASMAAQVVTPILSGALMDAFGTMGILFPYATIFVALSFVTMLFVKHGDSKPEKPKSKLEMLGGADD